MAKLVKLALLLCVMASGNAFALTSQQFYNKCSSAYKAADAETPQQAVDRALDAGSCSGYVGGVINGINLIGNMLGQQKAVKKNFICLPKGLQSQALLQDVLKYIKDNQSLSQGPVQLSVYNAMTTRYPCEEFDASK